MENNCQGLRKGTVCDKPVVRVVPVPSSTGGDPVVRTMCADHYAELMKILERQNA